MLVIALLCRLESPLSSFCDRAGFYIYGSAVEFLGIFKTIPQHSRNGEYMVISCFFVLFSAGNLLFTKGHEVVLFNR